MKIKSDKMLIINNITNPHWRSKGETQAREFQEIRREALRVAGAPGRSLLATGETMNLDGPLFFFLQVAEKSKNKPRSVRSVFAGKRSRSGHSDSFFP